MQCEGTSEMDMSSDSRGFGGAASKVRRERLELHGDLVKAVRKGDLFAVASLVQRLGINVARRSVHIPCHLLPSRRGAQLDLSFNLGYGEAGNCPSNGEPDFLQRGSRGRRNRNGRSRACSSRLLRHRLGRVL